MSKTSVAYAAQLLCNHSTLRCIELPFAKSFNASLDQIVALMARSAVRFYALTIRFRCLSSTAGSTLLFRLSSLAYCPTKASMKLSCIGRYSAEIHLIGPIYEALTKRERSSWSPDRAAQRSNYVHMKTRFPLVRSQHWPRLKIFCLSVCGDYNERYSMKLELYRQCVNTDLGSHHSKYLQI